MPDTQLFHIGVTGHLDPINEGPSKGGTVLPQETNDCYDTFLLLVRYAGEPAIVVIGRVHVPRHEFNITQE